MSRKIPSSHFRHDGLEFVGSESRRHLSFDHSSDSQTTGPGRIRYPDLCGNRGKELGSQPHSDQRVAITLAIFRYHA